jgi:hypothetical protein
MARINAVMSVNWRAMATNARLSVGFLGLRHWRDQGARHRPGERLSGDGSCSMSRCQDISLGVIYHS